MQKTQEPSRLGLTYPHSLTQEVMDARTHFRQTNEKNWRILQPKIDLHLDAYCLVFDELEGAHRFVADQTDLNLGEHTRALAVWLVSGRCISQAKAVICLLRNQFVNDVAPLLRGLHEANRLLAALIHAPDDFVRKWWDDKSWTRHKKVLAALDEWEREARVSMVRNGIRPPGATKEVLAQLYGRISEVSHHRRRHVEDTMSRPNREMPLGPHPCARVCAAVVGQAGPIFSESVTMAGNAMGHLLGREWFVERFEPAFQQLHRMQQQVKLDAASLS